MKTRSKKCGRIGLASASINLERYPNGKLYGCGRQEEDVPDGGMLLEPTVKYPRAHDDFTPAELKARLARYRRMALKELPLYIVPSPG